MSDNKRDSNRIGLVIDILMTRGDNSVTTFQSRNISDSGVFLECENNEHNFEMNEEVILQVSSSIEGEPAPKVPSVIVRINKEGIALQFKESM